MRHFALHSLEHMLRLRWLPEKDSQNNNGNNSGTNRASLPGQAPLLTHAEKESLKEAMLQVMARGTRDVAQEAPFIKIKVCGPIAIHQNSPPEEKVQEIYLSLCVYSSMMQ